MESNQGKTPAFHVVAGEKMALGVSTEQQVLSANVNRKSARLNPACIVCSPTNPKGLRITFHEQSNAICADWTPTGDWEGFQGTIHGGIITTVLDEAMSKAIIARNWEALTVDLRVRFRGRVAPGNGLCVRAWVMEKQKRKILTEATLTTPDGKEHAHAWATFLVPPNKG